MGEKLMRYIQWANEKGGMIAKVNLAQRTKIPSAAAALEPDSPDNIRKFKDALRQILNAEPPAF